jgi:hypothetical protein
MMEYVHSGLFNGVILLVIDDVLIDSEAIVTTTKLIFKGVIFLFSEVGKHNLLLSNSTSLPLHQTPICEYI